MEDPQITLARAAYSRYGAVTDYKNFQGNPMPKWEELPEKIRQAWVAAANPDTPTPPVPRDPEAQAQYFNNLLESYPTARGQVSDGYHTFDELYDHRIELFIALCRMYKQRLVSGPEGEGPFLHYKTIWRTQAHSDGSVWPGWFLLGINTELGKQITYHLPLSRWADCDFAATLDQAPTFDGHTSADVLARLKTL